MTLRSGGAELVLPHAHADHRIEGSTAKQGRIDWREQFAKPHHQNIWRGTAAKRANRGFIANHSSKGWWRTCPAQGRYALPARYRFVVSIRTPETDIDVHSPIARQAAAHTAVPAAVHT